MYVRVIIALYKLKELTSIKKTKLSIVKISLYVRTRQLGLFVNSSMLELTYRVQTFRDYSFSS